MYKNDIKRGDSYRFGEYAMEPKYEDIKMRFVDLGLPSGTLWATCNVGAENPWEYGKYYALGGTIGYSPEDNIPTSTSIPNEALPQSIIEKYKNSSNFVLDDEDDIATIEYGKGAHIPYQEQVRELNDTTYVTRTYVSNYENSGVKGYLYTSKINGNSVFFPFSGLIRYGKLSGDSQASNEYSREFYIYLKNKSDFPSGDSYKSNWETYRMKYYVPTPQTEYRTIGISEYLLPARAVKNKDIAGTHFTARVVLFDNNDKNKRVLISNTYLTSSNTVINQYNPIYLPSNWNEETQEYEDITEEEKATAWKQDGLQLSEISNNRYIYAFGTWPFLHTHDDIKIKVRHYNQDSTYVMEEYTVPWKETRTTGNDTLEVYDLSEVAFPEYDTENNPVYVIEEIKLGTKVDIKWYETQGGEE